MKKLPKEFQFKCDEHSKEQLNKLGIKWKSLFNGLFYYVSNNEILREGSKKEYRFFTTGEFIKRVNLSDYIDEEVTTTNYMQNINDVKNQPTTTITTNALSSTLDHSKLIVEMTKANVASLLSIFDDTNGIAPNLENSKYMVELGIKTAEETISQLKEKGYLK